MSLPDTPEPIQHNGTPKFKPEVEDGINSPQEIPLSPSADGPETSRVSRIIQEYLLERVSEFRRLTTLRDQGWKSVEGDRYFKRQRESADNADEAIAKKFYNMMKNIAKELHDHTAAFAIATAIATATATTNMTRGSKKGMPVTPSGTILDMCAAPGGFLEIALATNPGASAVAFSLPESEGGHTMLLQQPRSQARNPGAVTLEFIDITMLAADMGTTAAMVPAEHPDAANFVFSRRLLPPERLFDLVLCDGHVLRTHQRAPYRKNQRLEARRLAATQLVLALGHLRPGGTVVMLMHKLDAWDTLSLLHTFDGFSRVLVYKPRRGHGMRSSFYMVATDVRSRDPEALRAIEGWRHIWRVATFGSEEECRSAVYSPPSAAEVKDLLEEFGPKLIRLGTPVWDTQADALEKASFMKAGSAKPR